VGLVYAGVRTHVAERGLVTGRPLRGSTGSPTVTPNPPAPTTPPLPNPPNVTGITPSSITTDGATLTIVVDQNTRCYVVYDTDSGAVEADYAFATREEESFTYATHSQRLSNLADGTQYFYRAIVENVAGQQTISAQGNFTTLTAEDPPSPFVYPGPKALVYLAKPVQAPPAAGGTITDPQHGTQITRPSSSLARVRYASKAVWNADQSLGILDGTSGSRVLFNGQTLAVINPNVTTYGAFTWSTTNPNRAYAYSNPNIIRILNVTAAGISIVRSITLSAYSQISLGGQQGSQSNDDELFHIQFAKSNGNIGCAIWSSVTETIVGEVIVSTVGPYSLFDSGGISQSGAYLYQGFGGNPGTGVTQGGWRWPTASFSNANRDQLTQYNRHWDAGLLADGTTDVLFICSQSASGGNDNGGYAGIFRFDTGAWTPLISNWPNGSPSCRNILRPGYGYLSSFSDMDTNPTFPGYSTVIGVQFATPPVSGGLVEVYGNIHGPYSTDYTDQPNASASPTGDRVASGIDWDNTTVGAVIMGIDTVRA
jgi:hypothetical protein